MKSINKLNEKQVYAVMLLAAPGRGGMNYQEIADKVGIHNKTLSRWREQPDFRNAVMEQSMEFVKDEMGEVFQANLKVAKKGNTRAAELLYKLFGLLVEKQEVQQVVEDKRSTESIKNDIEELEKLLGDE